MYNYDTKNKSFIDLAKNFEDNYINNRIFLTLLNEDLLDIDPYSPKLSSNIKEDIIRECKYNMWYFIREIIKVPDNRGCVRRYNIHKGNMAINYLLDHDFNVYAELPFGTYKTTSLVIRILWQCLFNPDKLIFIVDNNIMNTDIILKKMKTLYNFFIPDYIRDNINLDKVFSFKESTIHEINELKILKILDSYESSEVLLWFNDHSTITDNNKILKFFEDNITTQLQIIATTRAGSLSKLEGRNSFELRNSCIGFNGIYNNENYVGSPDQKRWVRVSYNYEDLNLNKEWHYTKGTYEDNSTLDKRFTLQWI